MRRVLNERPPPPRSPDWAEVRPWRVAMRQALIGHRMGLDGAVRKAEGERARQRLIESVDLKRFATLGVYWKQGGRVALPVVVTKSAPVEFWSWRPDMPMSRGIWNIPIPAEREVLVRRGAARLDLPAAPRHSDGSYRHVVT